MALDYQQKGVYTVGELNLEVKRILSPLRDLWVRGEMSNITNHTSGHLFFTLKDSQGKINCIIFRQNTPRFEVREGMKVLVRGDVDIYSPTGSYQLKVKWLRPHGVGELFQAYQRLKEKLEGEGLFDPSRKKPLPMFPETVGVVTSPTGAVFHDIIHVLQRRCPVRIVLSPAQVQGEEAGESIVQALERLDRIGVDVIILARGGGSLEDLWPFNEERVARAISRCRVPVVSAVGHETDYTIADFTADRRAPTPSAAAEIVVPEKTALESQVETLEKRLLDSMRERINMGKGDLLRLSQQVRLKRLEERLQNAKSRLEQDAVRLTLARDRLLEAKKSQLENLASRLDSVSPLSTLRRGYTLTLKNGKPITQTSQVEPEDTLEIILEDGSLECKVIEVKHEKF